MLACTIYASLVRKKSLRRRMQHKQYLGSTQELLSGGFRLLHALLSIPDEGFLPAYWQLPIGLIFSSTLRGNYPFYWQTIGVFTQSPVSSRPLLSITPVLTTETTSTNLSEIIS
jgi:hypothetical protein